MWLFSNKSSNGVTTASSISAVLGVGSGSGSDDPLAGYTLDSPTSDEGFSGPFDLHWSRQSATHRKTGERATVFSCHLPPSTRDIALTTLAQVSKKMKTLRHPNILNWVAGTEATGASKASVFHIVTEYVVPLSEYLRGQADSSNFTYLASWGIYQVTRALGFLNDDCQLSHNAVCASSVYVNRSGEWKLGRLDFCTPLSEAGQQAVNIPRPAAYSAPGGHYVDAWGLACLIYEVFNPERLTEPAQLASKQSLERLPKQLVTAYRRLLSTRIPLTTSRARSPFSAFLKVNFFKNDYISTLVFLEEIQLKEKEEKSEFLAGLGQRAVGLFPDDICRYKILPHLVNSLKFGSAGVEALVPVLELAHLLSPADFDVVVLPGLVRLFAAPDRATRVRLLDQLPRFVEKLPRAVVESQIFPPVSAGFSDANPLVREATIRAMVHLAPTLPPKILNDALIRHLINLQCKDDQGGIRTNATICLAKLACRMEPGVRRGPLLNALLRATRDPFAPSRQAAVTSLAACQAFFSTQELAGKVIPCLSFVAVDAEKDIRETALKVLRGMLDRLERASEDPTASEPDVSVTGEGPSTGISAAGEKLTAAGVSFGNWALGALTSISSRLISSSTSSAASAQPPQKPSGASAPCSSRLNTDHQSVVSQQQESPSTAHTNRSSSSFQKARKSSWSDSDDKDADGIMGWDNEELTIDLNSLSVESKNPSPAPAANRVSSAAPKQQIDSLIDWDTNEVDRISKKPSTVRSKNSSTSSQVSKQQSLSPPIVSTASKKDALIDWEKEDSVWTASEVPSSEKRTFPSRQKPVVSSPKAAAAAAATAASATSRNADTLLGWQRQNHVAQPQPASDVDFFEELLQTQAKTPFSSSKSSSQSPSVGRNSQPSTKIASAAQKQSASRDVDDWDAW